jgi:hypothetical protein
MNTFNGSDLEVLLWTTLGVVLFLGFFAGVVCYTAYQRRKDARTIRRAKNINHTGFYSDLH